MANIGEKLDIIYGDATLGVRGHGFHYIFSYLTGGLESMVIQGKEWLYRTPRPTFWRASTDNDRGNGFCTSSGIWLSADMFMNCIRYEVWTDGKMEKRITAPGNNHFTGKEKARVVKAIFVYETITVPAAAVEVSYQIEETGKITVRVHYCGQNGLPELPVFGMRFVMPTKAVGYRYKGLSGETYPDRMDGAKQGVYYIRGLPVTQYLVPQDCGVHMETEWVEIYRNKTQDNSMKNATVSGVRFSALGHKFAFSCLPFTAEELENATHQEELPLPRRTVVSILGAVRGLGGIDSWGYEPEPVYHIDAAKDINYSFQITAAE